MLQKCVCGSKRFMTALTLEIHDIPVLLKADGSIKYDDTKGNSDGWDTSAQPEITCRRCGAIYHLEQLDENNAEDRPTYELRPMDVAPAAPGRDEEGG